MFDIWQFILPARQSAGTRLRVRYTIIVPSRLLDALLCNHYITELCKWSIEFFLFGQMYLGAGPGRGLTVAAERGCFEVVKADSDLISRTACFGW
jgi:hypothetical protein